MKYTLKKIDEPEQMSLIAKTKSSKGKSIVSFPSKYVVLDIETTGLNPRFNEIIELSALRVIDGEVQEEFNSLVKPKGEISYFISNLTGISAQTVKDAPDIKEAIKNFNDFCTGSIVLGHNVNFDIGFIDRNLQKHHDIPFSNDYIDSLRIARILLPQLKDKKLGTIARHFGLNTDGMHRGLKDCMVTNLCFCKFKEIVIEKYGTVEKFSSRFS